MEKFGSFYPAGTQSGKIRRLWVPLIVGDQVRGLIDADQTWNTRTPSAILM